MEEVWKDIKEFKGLYQVSTLGRVRSVDRDVNTLRGVRHYKERVLSAAIGTNGYYGVVLRRDGQSFSKMVHRLVAETFIGVPDNVEVDHIDYNKLNNQVSNLQILSHVDNVRRSYHYVHIYDRHGSRNPRAKDIICVDGNNTYNVSNCGKEFCKRIGMNYSTFRYKMQNGGIIINSKLYKYEDAS